MRGLANNNRQRELGELGTEGKRDEVGRAEGPSKMHAQAGDFKSEQE